MPKQILTMIFRQMSASSPSGDKEKSYYQSCEAGIVENRPIQSFVEGLMTVVILAIDMSTERESLTLKIKKLTW